VSVNPSSGSGDDEGSVLPSWFPTSFEGFRNLVIGVISSWLVVGLVEVGEELVASVLEVWSAIAASGAALGSAIGAVGEPILTVPWLLLDVADTTIVSIASSTGPAAPFVIPIMWGVLILVGLAAIRGSITAAWYIWQVIPGT